MPDSKNSFLNLVKHPLKFRLFLLSKLPAAYFSGVRVKEVSEQICAVEMPYRWFTKNPFRSTYFACLSMAAEMSTGVLAMSQTYGREPTVSMLVVKLEGEFLKKATGVTTFRCRDGKEIANAVVQATESGDPVSFTAKSVGTNAKGEVVAEFKVTWSFKMKSRRTA